MQLNDNPYLKQENYHAQYNENIEKLKNDPNLILIDKLIFEVFANDTAKKLLEVINERFLIPSLADRNLPNYSAMLIWADGFKDAFRFVFQSIKSHEQRILAGKDNDTKQ